MGPKSAEGVLYLTSHSRIVLPVEVDFPGKDLYLHDRHHDLPRLTAYPRSDWHSYT